MNVSINNRHGKVSPAVQEKVEAWLQDCQERFGEISSAQVIMEQSERQDEVEATLHIKGKDVFAKASGDNLYVAFDAMSDKIDRQLSKIKDKLTHKKGTPKPAVMEDEEPLDAEAV
ncbi:ribosome hibernation-promoting factor, HPF/YfiA family [Motiliproteus sediminis]|uniref:ribosome hibernation-promoting factor, HPF/YfiA family n=1 Tax=Motiliproteus sediminis TaxID=1468178 RepID=UPI001AEF3A3A|nr:ribosome-associated translation inhibitor RaiA [Motiliproteus sediminis]